MTFDEIVESIEGHVAWATIDGAPEALETEPVVLETRGAWVVVPHFDLRVDPESRRGRRWAPLVEVMEACARERAARALATLELRFYGAQPAAEERIDAARALIAGEEGG